jgi:hypothetical protein
MHLCLMSIYLLFIFIWLLDAVICCIIICRLFTGLLPPLKDTSPHHYDYTHTHTHTHHPLLLLSHSPRAFLYFPSFLPLSRTSPSLSLSLLLSLSLPPPPSLPPLSLPTPLSLPPAPLLPLLPLPPILFLSHSLTTPFKPV